MFSSFYDELKKIKKDKLILIVIIVIPLIVNLILGWELSGEEIKHIPMGIIDQDNSKISRMIADFFAQNDIFNVKYYPENQNDLENLIQSNKIRCGMIIPKDFSKNITELRSPTIMMIYDGSHMSIASSAKAKASEILLTLRTGVAIKQMESRLAISADQAEKIATAVQFNNTTLYNPAKSFKSFLNPGFGIAIVQTAIVLMAAVAVDIEELKKRKKRLLGFFLGKVSFYGLLGTLSMMLSILIQSIIYKVPFRGSYIDALILCASLSFASSSFAVMVSAWIEKQPIAIIANGLFFIPSTILAGYTWPLLAMPSFYQVLSKIIPFTYVASNIRDVYLKGSPITTMISSLQYLLIYFTTTLIIGTIGVYVRRGEILDEAILEATETRAHSSI